jgi:hypothetical protein
MLNNIVKHAAQVLDSSSAWLYLADQNPNEFRCEVSFGENGESVIPVIPSGEGLLVGQMNENMSPIPNHGKLEFRRKSWSEYLNGSIGEERAVYCPFQAQV